MTTAELMNHVVNSECTVEATLLLGALHATHWLYYGDDNDVLYDEGVDSEEVETTVSEFVARYPQGTWEVSTYE